MDEKSATEQHEARMELVRESLDPVIKDVAGYLFDQLTILRNGKIYFQLTVEDHLVADVGCSAQTGFDYRKENGDAAKDSAV